MEDDELMTVMHNTIPTVTKLMLPIAADIYKDDPGTYPLLKDNKLTTLKGNAVPTECNALCNKAQSIVLKLTKTK